MSNEVLEFIRRRWKKDANWLDGNCYWFAHILTTRFPHLGIYYLPIIGHFVAGDGISFYDFSGLCELKEKPHKFSDIKKDDPLWYQRLIRDCIL